MRCSIVSIILLFLTWIQSGQAQMFNTIQECDALYGKAVSPTDLTSDVRFYQQDNLTVKILFTEGKAAVITFTPAKKSGQIKEATQQKLLDVSAAGNKWEKVEGEGARTWQRSDGLAFALYDSKSGELTLLSTDYLERTKAEDHTTASH